MHLPRQLCFINETMAKRIKGILFDLGDTLLNFGKVDIPGLFEGGARLAYEYLQQLGLDLPSFARFHRQQLWAIRWNYFKSRFTRREFNSLEVLGHLSRRMGHALTKEQTLELAWLWYEPLSRCATVEEGVGPMLEGLRACGMSLGIVSNTFVPGEVLDRHLAQAGLLEYLPVRVYSCDVSVRKPQAEIFRIALDRAGLAADETMFVGDSLVADVKGSKRLGMISVLKDPAGRYGDDAAAADHHVGRLSELAAIVAEYNR